MRKGRCFSVPPSFGGAVQPTRSLVVGYASLLASSKWSAPPTDSNLWTIPESRTAGGTPDPLVPASEVARKPIPSGHREASSEQAADPSAAGSAYGIHIERCSLPRRMALG
jgi:hypothetical protein